MSEMIERIKSVLRSLPVRDTPAKGGELDELRLGEAARTVIKAMREPTQAMLDASFRRNDDNDWKEATLANYQAMIDEALKLPSSTATTPE